MILWTRTSVVFVGKTNSNARWKQIVGNKAKGRISKRVLQENKTRQIFRKRIARG